MTTEGNMEHHELRKGKCLIYYNILFFSEVFKNFLMVE